MDDISASSDQPLVLVTLVHGTWARGLSWRARRSTTPATWCQHNSAFMTRLRKQFAREGVKLESRALNWSGANSIRERYAVGKELAWNCDALSSAEIALHIVIGHSHGGNIAMEALEELHRRRQQPPAVVTIATPFLYTDSTPRIASTPLPGCGTLAVLTLMLTFLLETGRHAVPFLNHGWLAIASLASGLFLASWMMIFFFNPSGRAEHLLVWRATPRVPDPQTEMLVLRGTEDEAGMALVLSLIAIRLTDLLTLVYKLGTLIAFVGGSLLILSVFIALIVSVCAALVFRTNWVDHLWVFIQSFEPVAVASIWALGIFTIARLILPALAKGSFGWELIRGSALFTVTANSAPDSDAKLTIQTMRRAYQGPFGLLHSLYDHAEIAPSVVSWTLRLLQERGVQVVKPNPLARFPPERLARLPTHMKTSDLKMARTQAQNIATLMQRPWAVIEVGDDYYVLCVTEVDEQDLVVARFDPDRITTDRAAAFRR